MATVGSLASSIHTSTSSDLYSTVPDSDAHPFKLLDQSLDWVPKIPRPCRSSPLNPTVKTSNHTKPSKIRARHYIRSPPDAFSTLPAFVWPKHAPQRPLPSVAFLLSSPARLSPATTANAIIAPPLQPLKIVQTVSHKEMGTVSNFEAAAQPLSTPQKRKRPSTTTSIDGDEEEADSAPARRRRKSFRRMLSVEEIRVSDRFKKEGFVKDRFRGTIRKMRMLDGRDAERKAFELMMEKPVEERPTDLFFEEGDEDLEMSDWEEAYIQPKRCRRRAKQAKERKMEERA